MLPTRRSLLAAALAPLAAQAQSGSFETDAERERFLREAKIVRRRSLSEGITNSVRLTLALDDFEHEAQFQSVDESKPIRSNRDGTEITFRDTYAFNIAAYKLSRLLGLDNVPVCVERDIDGDRGAMSWWIDDVLMTEKTRYIDDIAPPDREAWNRQIHAVRVFDELIYNTDRNLGNLIITRDWRIWMIDHTRAFLIHEGLRNQKRLARCERKLLEALRKLDKEATAAQLEPWCRRDEIDGLFARRDSILAHFEERIRAQGEEQVLYDL